MAGQGWSKNKKGFMVNADGKTARQVRAEKRAAAKDSKRDASKATVNTEDEIHPITRVPKKFGGSIAELKQQDRDPLLQFIDTKAITTKIPVSRYSKQEIEDLATKIARGETDQLNPVVVKKVGFEKYEVVKGAREFYAVQRARELNREIESVETFLVKPNEVKAAKKQLSLFKNERHQITGKGTDRFKIDISDIDSSVSPKNTPLAAQSKSLLEVGGNLVPVVLKKKKGGRFEVVSGHQVYHAAVRAKERQKSFETVNAVIID